MTAWFDDALDWICPRRCPACGKPGYTELCAECGAPEPAPTELEVHGTPLFVIGRYGGGLGAAIRRFKYEPRPELAGPLAKLLAARLAQEPALRGAAFAPVPLHFERLVQRGFNQSALVARALSSKLGCPVFAHLLRRRRETAQQARLDRARRERNLQGAFEVSGRPSLPLILVDDVVTTGSTARACIDALSAVGLRVTAIAALAYADQSTRASAERNSSGSTKSV